MDSFIFILFHIIFLIELEIQEKTDSIEGNE